MAGENERKRGRTWEKEETLALLERRGEENVQQKLRECKKKKPIWVSIINFVKASGYEDRDFESCKTRMHTLVSAYSSFKNQNGRSGAATPNKKPQFFDELEEMFEW